jgi:hypothetical protein
LQEEALEIQKRVLGEKHPDTLTSMNKLALHKLHTLRAGQTERRAKRKRDEDDQLIDPRPTDKKRKLVEEETTKTKAAGEE